MADKSYREEIGRWLRSHKEQIIKDLTDLVKIPSVAGAPDGEAPFGKECLRVLYAARELYRREGFSAELDPSNKYLTAEYGSGEKSIGLFGHADVVPVADDWILTKPFEPMEKDGFLVGRGVLDDKSGVIGSLYILKAFHELGIPLKSRLLSFVGSCEENGMADIRHYAKTETPPDFSFVPDTAFPLFIGNKGVLRVTVTSDLPFFADLRLNGGKYGTTVGNAEAYLNGKLISSANGISKHTALPEGSVNAGALAAQALISQPGISENDRKILQLYSEVAEDIYGEKIGIAHTDAKFGKLTCANMTVATENGKLSFTLNIRHGIGVDDDEIIKTLTAFFEKRNWSVRIDGRLPAKLTDENDPCVIAALDAYRRFTGDHSAVPHLNAGGTYAMFLPRAVEIGPVMWNGTNPFGLPEGHGRVHQPDEMIGINDLLNAMELTALMILDVDKVL